MSVLEKLMIAAAVIPATLAVLAAGIVIAGGRRIERARRAEARR